MILILRSGRQWNRLPREFGNNSPVHRTFRRRVILRVFEMGWAAPVEHARHLGLLDYPWQSADCAMGKARLRGRRRAATPRIAANPAPSAGRRPRDTEGHGRPIAASITGANVHGAEMLRDTIEAVVIDPPDPRRVRQRL